MPRFCTQCGRPKGSPYHFAGICDTATLSDGRTVHRRRVEPGGDLHDSLGSDLKVVSRRITPSMRAEMEKAA
jgi:hypothetical protein